MNEEIIQGTSEWFERRKRSVTSTDAAIINGTNTFNGNTPYILWQRKMGLMDEMESNEIMKEGLVLEKEARNLFNEINNTRMIPLVLFHPKNEWYLASLDGYQEDLDYILEIKCGEKTYERAENGEEIPPYYYDQIQHALLASEKDLCKYLCYRSNKEPIILDVKRNDDYIARLFEKEIAFYECMRQMLPPALGEKDYVYIDSEDANEAALTWKRSKAMLDEAKKYEQMTREVLLGFTDDGNCIFPAASVRIERINAKGIVDWKKVCNKWNINEAELEPFRKQSIGYPRISIIKQNNG